jgi:hypothetical protein
MQGIVISKTFTLIQEALQYQHFKYKLWSWSRPRSSGHETKTETKNKRSETKTKTETKWSETETMVFQSRDGLETKVLVSDHSPDRHYISDENCYHNAVSERLLSDARSKQHCSTQHHHRKAFSARS